MTDRLFLVVFCDCCGQLGNGFKTCSRCYCASYCSEECQKVAWPLHKELCDFMKEEKRIEHNRTASKTRLLNFVLRAEEQLKERYSFLIARGIKSPLFTLLGNDGVISAPILRYSLVLKTLPRSLESNAEIRKVIRSADLLVNEILGSESLLIHDEKAFLHIMIDGGNSEGVLIPFSDNDLPRVIKKISASRSEWIKTMKSDASAPQAITESMIKSAIKSIAEYKSLKHFFFYTEEKDAFVLYNITLE